MPRDATSRTTRGDQTPERWTEYVRLDELEPAPRNAKRHDVPGIIRSLTRFGLTQVVAVVDERTGKLHSGHGRREALLKLHEDGKAPPAGVRVDEDGGWLVPVGRGWRSKNAKDAEAALVGDNQLTIAGGWDMEELAASLKALGPRGLAGTGFTLKDLAGPAAAVDPKDDHVAQLPDAPAVAKAGDVWTIGPHRLMVGDCRNPEHVAHLLDGATVNLAVTSPPYADRRKYDGETEFRPIPPGKYVAWFEPVAAIVADHLATDGSWVVNIRASAADLDRELYVMDLVLEHVRSWGWHLADEFCWERVGVPKRPVMRLKNMWEPVFHFARGRWKWNPDNVSHPTDDAIIPVGPGGGDTNWSKVHGQGRSSVFGESRRARSRGGNTRGSHENVGKNQGTNWAPGELMGEGEAYPGNRLPNFNRSHAAVGHPAAFPWELPGFFTRLLTDEGDHVYDPFVGSGSTILAAHETNRIGFGMELSAGYADQALARLHRDTGLVPTCKGKKYPA